MPVEVRSAVPLNDVTVLLPASRAVILILNGVPATCEPIGPPVDDSTRKLLSDPAFTEKLLLVPFSVPPVRVAVIAKLPVFVIVTATEASTPLLNDAVVPPPWLSVPLEVISAVPANDVTVLPFTSLAVSFILNGTVAVCDGMFPPPAASNRKLLSAPAFTANVLLVPVSDPPVRVAVSVKLPVLLTVTP